MTNYETNILAISNFGDSQGWNSFDQYPRQVADVNGDGRADIIGFGDENVLVSLGESNGTFGSAIVAKDNEFTINQGGWDSFDKYPRQVADVNGDGRADIIGFGSDNVLVSLGESNGTFGSAIVADDEFNLNQELLTGFGEYPRLIGDVNGDGRADIVEFAEDGTYVALANNQYILAGYLPSWEISSATDPATIPVDRLTHLFYAFADVDAEGNV